MLGLMQDFPLTVESILHRGEQYFGDKTILTRTVGGTERITMRQLGQRARVIAGILDRVGVSAGGRVGSFGWNTANHMALYFGVPATGRILHTLNIRLFPEQLVYTVNHAEDEAIFVDRSLLGLFAKYLPQLQTVRAIIVFDDGANTELPDDPRVLLFDDAAGEEAEFRGRVTDENTAAAICYTTGTTGNPKGVLYSHRSTWLHAFASQVPTAFGLTEGDIVMPVVPMFHAMSWGLPYAATMAGANLVMPGPDLSPASLLELLESERVTITAGVPTIWMAVLPLLAGRDLSHLRTVICGGSAVPRSLSEGWREAIGVPILQAWGMTELSPMGSVASLRSEFADLPEEQKADIRATAGFAPIGVEMRIVDAETRAELPWDDTATGELECRGPWIARQYYRTDEPGEQFSADGWLKTGDVAAISRFGYLRLVDRTKDLIKSGGEWISSVDLENTIMGHPEVAEAAVIALAHPKWMERPFACVVLKPGSTLDKDGLLAYLSERVDRWGMPDDVEFIAEIPKTSVGKFSKKTLRERFADRQLG
ncbi:long-chain fatty acid--CoA ligase [Jatrophihabitans telluris]|uniref:Long-chain fatty acid--CoA ligase n=1 Tax=Jatrophihabitans telluris TaxID=2038343 RepID=A0ABY4R0I0_9ACTN|nr:long-chain fatty acid--CoA ligase [Jatrophihabitans telluris]UQX89098.1 long-chain fatty acid--CoA ligase [Jatrophihabitans telluris]